MQKLNLIGCGRVGKTLGKLWHDRKVLELQDVLTTAPDTAANALDFIGAGRVAANLNEMRPADLWMLAVPDRLISETAAELARSISKTPPGNIPGAVQQPPIAFHCSGALDINALLPLQNCGWRLASAHCILSFANPASAVHQFEGTPCSIEASPEVYGLLEPLFTAIGARPFALDSGQKMLYHAAAVFATNFLPVLQGVAEALWRQSGVPDELASSLRVNLLRNAVENMIKLGPAQALTGPAARGDNGLVMKQGNALEVWNTESAQAYRALSVLASQLAHQKGIFGAKQAAPVNPKQTSSGKANPAQTLP
jgi:predicted short-subunit dehydrogenase-like oxidoreductase (DUF2520 family)